MSQTGDLILSEQLRRIFRWWWLVVVFMLAGGLGGYLFSFARSPLYESNAAITTAIDYAYAGRLTDYEEDHMVTAIGDVIGSSEVIDQVADMISARGLVADGDDLSRHLTLSRQGYRWQLSSRYPDPKVAQSVNQVWAQSALGALQQLKLRAQQGLQEYLLQGAVETCFSQAVVLDPVSNSCSLDEIQALQKSIEAAQPEDAQALISSLHLSATSYQLTQTPSLPTRPIRNSVNSLVLAGIMVGLLTAILFFQSGFLKRRLQG